MNRDKNKGWKRWVRSSAEEARKKESAYNDRAGGLSSYEQIQRWNAQPIVKNDDVDSDKSQVVDRRDENLLQEWSRSLANGATKFMNDFLDMSVNNAKSKVLKESNNQKDLEKVQHYVDLVSRKKELETLLASGQADSNLDGIVSKLKQIDSEKAQLDNYFLTEGKNSDAIFDLMYNTKNNSILDDIKSIYSYIKGPDGKLESAAINVLFGNTIFGQLGRSRDFFKNTIPELGKAASDFWKGVSGNKLQPTVGAIERVSRLGEKGLEPLAEILGAAVRGGTAAINVIPGGKILINGVNSLYKTVNNSDRNFIDDFDDITKKAIRNSSPDSYLSNLSYKGDSVTKEDVDTAVAQSKERQQKLMEDFLFEEAAAKAGKVTCFGNTLWSYNPTIDSDWKLQDEEFGDNLSDIFTMPTHVLASTASTAQMFKYQIPNMGLEALTSWVLKKYGTSALLGGPVGTAIKGVATIGTAASGIAASTASRDVETADEAVGAYEERVIQDATRNGADYGVVQNAIDSFLQQNYPDLLSRNTDDRLKFGIALGVKTGDDVWDKTIKDSRKGLQKLVNANNSLALKDYAETLPFLPYTGSLFKDAVKKQVFMNSARKHFAGKGKTPSTEALQRLYRTSGVQEQLKRSFIDPNGRIQHTIDKAAKRLIEKDSPKLQKMGLLSRDLSKYLINRVPYAIASSITEGIEEGQQELLKERYKRGEYDDYSSPYSMFDLVEGLSTLSLANGAIGDYFGINYGDIDNGNENVHKVMNIGLASALTFSNARHAATNVPLLDADNANLRSLFKDIRTSNAVANMIADDYQRAQDYQHAGIFYEMIRRGATADGIADRLQFMLNNDKQTSATQQMVDDSKTIADNVEFMYNQKWLANMMKESGYKKYGAEHKQAILEGAVKITDLQKGGQLTQQQGKDVTNAQLNIQWDIQKMLSESSTDEQRQEFFNAHPWMKHLYDNFDKIYQSYKEKVIGSNASTRLNITKALNIAVKRNNDPTGNKDFAQKAISTLTKLGVGEQAASEALDDAISGKEKPSDIARRLADVASPINTKEQSFENLANRYFAYLREVALDRALKLSTNEERLLQHTRRNTGLDINTKTLKGVISRLKEIKDDFIKRHRESGFNPESENTAFHKDSGYDWIFDGDEEFDKHVDLLMSWYINGALLPSMRTVAAPYMFGSISPKRLKQAVTNGIGKFDLDEFIDKEDELNIRLKNRYSKLNTDQKKQLEDAVTRYTNVHGDLLEFRRDLEEFGVSETEADIIANIAVTAPVDAIQSIKDYFEASPKQRKQDRETAKKLNEESAKRFILNRLKESESRSRIARRVFIDEAMTNAGVEHSEQDVEDLAKDQEAVLDNSVAEERMKQSSTDRQKTDAELAARRKYNHETERQQQNAQSAKNQLEEARQQKPDKEELINNSGDESYSDPVGPDDVDDTDDVDVFDYKEDESDVEETQTYSEDEEDNEVLVYDEDEDHEMMVYDEDDYEAEEAAIESSLPTTEEAANEWVEVTDEYLLDLDENGNIVYDGTILPQEQAQYIRTQFLLLDGIDRQWLDQNSVPNGQMSDIQQMKNVNPEYIGNWLANTFFYAVDEDKRNVSVAERDDQGNIIDPKRFNGVILPKEIGTADELSKRLLQQDWLYGLQRRGKVYYIVTLDKGIQSIKKGTDKRDAYTISLVIEDEDKCFLTFLRDLGKTQYKDKETGEVVPRNSELWWRNWLVTKNVNAQLINKELGGTLSNDHNERAGQIIKFIDQKTREYLKSVYVGRYGDEVGFENYMSGEGVVHNDEFSTTSRSSFINTARRMIQKRYAINDQIVLSDDEAKKQIDKLRELRNQIIELYTDGSNEVSKTIRRDIVPERLLQSNGKIDTMKNTGDLPVYRPLASDDVSVLEIEKDFQNGELVIGYGKGAAAYGNKFVVQNIKAAPNTNDGVFHGKGLSGKIYMMIKGLTRDAERVPVMLAEEKFNTQTRIKNGIKETRFIPNNGPVTVLDIVNGQVQNVGAVDNDGYTYMPSAAEVIFYMLTKRGQFAGINSANKQKTVVDFIINNGERTLFEKRSGWEKRARRNYGLFNTLTSKQLAWFKDDTGRVGLSIGLPEFDEESGGQIYKLHRFNEDELFAPDGTTDQEILDNCRRNRQMCIAAIARQMHWNTDQPTLNDFFDGEKLGFSQIKSDIDLQIKPRSEFNTEEEYLSQSYNILGCPELSFSLKDILSKDTGFRNISWLIKNKKLKTDASQQIFADPYVFGIGAKNRNQKEKDPNIGVDNDDTPPVIPPKQDVSGDVDFFEVSAPSEFGTKFVARNEEQRKQLVDAWNDRYSKSNKYKILDRIAVIHNSVYETDWDDQYADDDMLKDVVEEIAKNVISKWKEKNPDYTVSDELNIQLSAEDLENIGSYGYEIMPIVVQFDTTDGKTVKATVTKQDLSTNALNPATFVSGVYKDMLSKSGSAAKLNEIKARKWLFQKLGINGYNVWVQKGAIRGANGKLAYGATTLACDVITRKIAAHFILSTQEGSEGVQYHEAWHYVNLLLHDEQQRKTIYDEYAKYNKSAENLSDEEIEEMMADDFMRYMMLKEDRSFVGKIKRFFQNIADLINLVLDRKQYRKIYENIANGGYRTTEMNDQAVIDFQNKYGALVLSTAESDNLTLSQYSYSDVYEAIDSVINQILVENRAYGADRIKSLFNDKDYFDKLFKPTVDNMIGIATEARIGAQYVQLLEDLKTNQDLIKAHLAQKFSSLGFNVRFKSQVPTDIEEKESDPDNTWDKLDISTSRKDGASAKIKMFLSTIPAKELIVDRKGNFIFQDVKTKFGTTKLFNYDEVWSAVVQRLHGVQSYEELRTEIKHLSKEHNIFNSLEQRMRLLDNHNDSELKSQLFGICNAHVNHVQTINVSNPFEAEWEDEFDYSDLDDEQQGTGSFTNEVLDVTKEWALSDDGAYNPGFTLPRNWSQSLASTSFVHYDPATKKLQLSEEFVYTKSKNRTGIYNMVLNIDTAIQNQKKKLKSVLGSEQDVVDQTYKESANEILGKFIKLCNVLCVPIDSAVILHMFANSENYRDVSKSKAHRYYDFVTSLTQDTTRGSIRDVVNKIKKAFDDGQDYINIEGKQKAFDEIYNNLSLQSQISRFAINYSRVYPKLGEISTRNANGDKIYPVNLNNYVSDKVTDANKNPLQFAEDVTSNPYNKRSIIAQEAKRIVSGDSETELRLNTFVGMKQKGATSGNDYMQMTPMEDYLAKLFLTENNNLVFPTMADKKTWYSLSIGTSSLATKKKIGSTSGFNLQHSVIVNHIPSQILYQVADEMYSNTEEGKKDKSTGSLRFAAVNKFREDPKNKKKVMRAAEKIVRNMQGVNYRRFDGITLNRFKGYLLDEIDALKHFYSIERIQSIIKDPSLCVDNYDSDIVDNEMTFGGNGGLFRYFYNIEGYNMNHRLQALYEIEKNILKDQAHDDTAKEGDQIQNISIKAIPNKYSINNGNGTYDYDGFELIRQYLDELESKILQDSYTELVNDWLIDRVDVEIAKLSDENSPINLVQKIGGRYYPKAIPQQFLKSYVEQLKDIGFAGDNPMYKTGDTWADEGMISALYSLIGNHVANSMTSVIEIEKVFSGDPAFYQYKYKGKSTNVKYTHTFENGTKTTVSLNIADLTDPYSDKIKRLGGLLSPGTNLRLDFNQRFKRKNKGEIEDVNEIELDERAARKYFSEEESSGRAILGTSKYTIVDANDIRCPSTQLQTIRDEIKRQTVIDLIHTRLIKYSGNLSDLYYEDETFNKLYDSVKDQKIGDKTIQQYVEDEVDIASDPYTKINVADAQVMIRPAMYRKIRIGLGDWSKDDERAYWLLETDDKWMEDPEKAKVVKKFQQYVLKMSYFDNEYNRAPIYNKMAIFPIFKFQRSTDTGKQIYDRMNMVGNEIDMIAFKSAIKVGATKDGLQLIDENATADNATSHLSEMLKLKSNKSIDYSNGEIIPNNSERSVSVRIQDLKNLRLQLNTHAHEDMIRSIGTQMFKIGFSNIFDDLEYGQRKRKGSEIRQHIMKMINALTQLGVQELYEEFYTKNDAGNYSVDEEKVKSYMLEIIHNNGLGSIAEDIIQAGGVVSSLQSRKVFEQSVSKKVNKSVVDINTLGGTAVQQSCFGYEAFDNVISDEYVSYNNGKSLTWYKEDGSMEVMLSIKFFKSAVPASERKTYKQFRQYLIDHDMINGIKTDGTQSTPKPFGIGYRIPTQGMSSTFVFTVADVLPEQVGDLIIVPREFTAQTGSDFDIDKLYLATLSYKNGELEQYDENEPSKNALSNELLLDYMDIISDKKNFYQSRGSIDTFTEILQTDLLPLLKKPQDHYFDGGIQLLPWFQAFRKMEFATGKTGIGPYALNVTNLALTQASRLTIDFGSDEDNQFGLLPLYSVHGKDHRMISGWLSAMVNAHVDVAKDPYIFALNVNKATYNMCNFLIRTGNGLASFAFIAQPILKLYAQQKNAKGGVYGKSLDLGSDNPFDTNIGSQLKNRYKNAISKYIQISKNGQVNKKAAAILEILNNDGKSKKNNAPALTNEILRDVFNTSWKDVISLEKNIKSLEDLKKGTPEALIEHYIHQILCMYAFEKLDLYAQAMSSMVTASQIDTKKFGNDITQHRIWMNNHYLQKYDASVDWKIDKPDFPEPLDKKGNVDKKARSSQAMNYYFSSLFLESKLNNAINTTRQLLEHHLIIATKTFDGIFTSVMRQIYGEKEFIDYSNGSENGVLVSHGWEKVFDKNKPSQISNALDNICRFYALYNLGTTTYPEFEDLTVNQNAEQLVEKLSSLYFGNDQIPSIFQRGADLINKLNAVYNKETWKPYAGIVTINGKITNALLNYITPMTASQNHPLGRFLLRDSSFDTGEDVKSSLRIAWLNLINHPNKEVSDFAKDLIIYAYYSKYDQNTPGSFFDIVPLQYRQQYDDALTRVMYLLNDNNTEHDDKLRILFGDQFSLDRIMDIMYRNYWYDDDIVKPYNYHDDEFDESRNVDIFDRDRGETVLGGWCYDKDSQQSFPGMVITTRTNLPYFKLMKNNSTYLYKKVGTVERINKDISKKNGDRVNVYAITPKAGFREKNNMQFEFYADRDTDSIFDVNMLPKQFAEDVLKNALQTRINAYNSSDSKYRLVLDWDDIPEARKSSNMSAYIQTVAHDEYFNGNQIKNTSIIFDNVSDKSGQKNADVIINVVLDPSADNVNKRVNQKFEDKVVTIQFGKQLTAEQIEQIKEMINHDDEQVDNRHVVHFVTNMSDKQFYNLDILPQDAVDKINSRIEQLKNEHLDLYRKQLIEDGTEQSIIDELIEQRESEFEPGQKQYNFAKSQAGIEVSNEYVSAMVQDLLVSGININRLTSAASASNTVISLGTTHAANISTYDLRNTIYCNETMPQTDRKTYSQIVGRIGRIVKADQIIVDERLRQQQFDEDVTQSSDALDDALSYIKQDEKTIEQLDEFDDDEVDSMDDEDLQGFANAVNNKNVNTEPSEYDVTKESINSKEHERC